jgi:hypothetical protein
MKGTVFVLLFFAPLVYGQESAVTIRSSLRWDRMELSASLVLDFQAEGIRIPTGRSLAEERLSAEYPQLVQPFLLSIPLDSSDTIGDLIERGEFPLRRLNDIALSARRLPPAVSRDLRFLSTEYTIDLNRLSSVFVQHSRPMEISRTLIPVPAPAYTGIIVIASKALPVHGRNSAALPVPCLFPKIWDTEMNLIYERNMVDPRQARGTAMIKYAAEESVFRPAPSGLSPELLDFVGPNPLRIIARGVFGIRPTDPIIDREDALLIISSEENRRLLMEGRVAIIVHQEVLELSPAP